MAIGQDFGVGAVDGEDFGLVAGAGRQEKIHWTLLMGSRTEYGIEGGLSSICIAAARSSD